MNLEKALQIFDLADLTEIDLLTLKELYRKKAKTKHPDKKGGSNKDFVELREAYLILTADLKSRGITTSSRQLKTMSKEEILTQYYRDTTGLQLKIEEMANLQKNQEAGLEKTQLQVDSLQRKYQLKKERNKHDLEKKINQLSQRFFKKFLFFSFRVNEKKFWKEYQKLIHKYQFRDKEIDIEFYQNIIDSYSNGLNQIVKSINEI